MRLSGELNEIPLPQLIEASCHERQTGQLWVGFPQQPGIFYFQDGALVDAEVGGHAGAEAVYQALTLTKDASFEFRPGVLSSERTIHETWQMVVLEGFIRLQKAASKNAGASGQAIEPPSQTPDTVMPLGRRLSAINQASFAGWQRISLVSVAVVVMISVVAVIAAISGRRGEKEKSTTPIPAVKQAAVPSPNLPEPTEPSSAGLETMQSVAAKPSATFDSTSAAIPVEGLASSDLSSGRGRDAANQGLSDSSKPEENRLAAVTADGVQVIQPIPSPEAKVPSSATTQLTQENAAGNNDAAQKSATPDLTGKLQPDAQPQQAVQASTADKEPTGEQEVIVAVQIEHGRVLQAYIPNSRSSMKAYETTALRIARGLRFPASKTGTESVTIKVNQQK